MVVVILSILCCVSCVGPGMYGPKVDDVLTAYDSKDDVDTACSYFYFLWARQAELNGRDDEALEAYEKSIVCDGQADHVVSRLAALLLKMGKNMQAVHWLKKMIAARPNELKLKIFLADLYASSSEPDKAIVIYEQGLLCAPKNNVVMLKLGKLYLHKMEYGKARAIFERLIKNDPDSFVGSFYLARLYRELGDVAKAARVYERIIDTNWSVPMALEAAEFYEQQGEDKRAIVIYKRIIAEEVKDETAIARLVRIYLRSDRSADALSLLRSLRDETVDSLRIDFTIARIYLEKNDYAKAVVLFKELLDRDPTLGKVRSLLALSYYKSGDKQQAKDLLAQVEPDAEGYEETTLQLVKVYAEDSAYAEARHLLRSAIANVKGDERLNYYFVLMALYEKEQKTDMVDRVFAEVLKQFPNSVESYLRYGMFLDRQGSYDASMIQMEKVLTMEPDNVIALNFLGYNWADRGVRLEEALDYIKRALVGHSNDGYIRDSLGWVYFKLGEVKKAVVELKKALLDEPGDPTIREHLGDVYNAMHESRKALANYRKSLQLYNDKAEQWNDFDHMRGRLQDKIKTLRKNMEWSNGAGHVNFP